MQFPPFPHYLVPPRSKYSPQHHILKHPQFPFLPQCQRQSFTPIQNNRQNYNSICPILCLRYKLSSTFTLVHILAIGLYSYIYKTKRNISTLFNISSYRILTDSMNLIKTKNNFCTISHCVMTFFHKTHEKKNFFPPCTAWIPGSSISFNTFLFTCKWRRMQTHFQHNFIHNQQSATCFGCTYPSSGWI